MILMPFLRNTTTLMVKVTLEWHKFFREIIQNKGTKINTVTMRNLLQALFQIILKLKISIACLQKHPKTRTIQAVHRSTMKQMKVQYFISLEKDLFKRNHSLSNISKKQFPNSQRTIHINKSAIHILISRLIIQMMSQQHLLLTTIALKNNWTIIIHL